MRFDAARGTDAAEDASVFRGRSTWEEAMNWDQIQGKWKQLTGSIQATWGHLTGDEVAEIDGDREKLEGKIQEKYGKTKEEAKQAVDDWMAKS